MLPTPKMSEGVWEPQAVCCSKESEIFVVNDGDNSVYRYTYIAGKKKWKEKGRILREENKPAGIVMNENGLELYVVIPRESKVKIFERR